MQRDIFDNRLTRLSVLALVFSLSANVALAEGSTTTAKSSTTQDKADKATLTQQLDAFITKGMADWKIPGLSIVVVNDKGVQYEKGFGVRELGKPGKVDEHTAFGMMSTTKAMTALALAMLVDEGKLSWDDPVIKHLPNLRLPNAYLTENLTVSDTLRHTSGMQEADLLWMREDMKTKEVLSRLNRVPTTAALRSDFIYNNVMYQVAGEIISAASSMPWERFIASRILGPIGMSESFSTMTAMRASQQKNVSLPHYEIDAKVHVIDDVTVDVVPAAGATWSSAHDAGKWLAFLLGGGKVGEKRLVSEANFKELFSPQVAIRPAQWGYPSLALTQSHVTAYGLGWFLQDYRGQYVAMHTGSMDGRTAIIGLIPDAKVGVYVFGNLDHAEFRHALMWQVLDMYTGAPARDWNGETLKLFADLKKKTLAKDAEQDAKRIKDTKPSHALAAYTGSYVHPAWGEVKVILENDALVLRIGSSPNNMGRLEHWHFDTFRTKFGDGRYGWDKLSFSSAQDGSIGTIVINNDNYVRVVVPKTATP